MPIIVATPDRAAVRTRLETLVSATTAPALTDIDIELALDAARIVDADGLGPADDGYVETIDLDYAAAEAFTRKHVLAATSPQVKKFTAEGASFDRVLPDFERLADYYRNRSTAGGSGGISVIELVPETPDRLLPRSVS